MTHLRITPVLCAWALVMSACASSQPPAPSTPVAAPTATAAPLPTPTAEPPLPLSGERWLRVLRRDLLPFYARSEAYGLRVGQFPSVRCDDGTRVDFAAPCKEVAGNPWLMQRREYVVSMSRQTYGYGVAFHMTGDLAYLRLAKAGVDFLRSNAFDRKTGGTYASRNMETLRWEPAESERNPQEQAYALLGIAMYYYLTRDPEVLPDLVNTQRYIFERYDDATLNALRWTPDDPTKKLTAQLDQLNAYMVLLGPIIPEADQPRWQAGMRRLIDIMRAEFYSEEEGLFFTEAPSRDALSSQRQAVDFGHSIKAFWMIRAAAQQLGDDELVRWAEQGGLRVLDKAYLAEPGTWANGLGKGGTLELDKDWWIYNELDQFTATLAMSHPEASKLQAKLSKTQTWYLEHFVDRTHGEVWTAVTADGRPKTDLPKKWPWKSAYHVFEHALVNYIAGSQVRGQPIVLHYAFAGEQDRSTIHPYFYRGEIQTVESLNELQGTVQRVTFKAVR
jgi:mannose/cellobiose epimerase-like protein (N-acyl-D-glucosamine 2-epimerase family)